MPQTGLRARRWLFGLLLILLSIGPLALTATAAGELTMQARILLQGHARVGSWMAIEVLLTNAGPAVQGELTMDGGPQGQTRFAMRVDLPTGARQTYVLHAQPPAFARTLDVSLVAAGGTLAKQTVAYIVHDAGQLVVGVLAERPQGIVGEIDLPPSPSGAPAVVVPLTVGDLPDRVEGWRALDRLVWQDVDSNTLKAEQLAALRGWIAAGGRLVIAGGSAGIGTLNTFPADLLPFRPTSTVDVAPSSLTSLLGQLPATARDLPAMAGELDEGRALATSGDRAVAAEMSYGGGRVTLIGFDPTTPWLAETKSIAGLWRGLLPPRQGGDASALTDDSQILSAVNQLPALALPPIGGLLVLLAAYILVIGPLNYLVLRRLDRREWAWVTMPAFVLAFAAAAYGYGSVLRGTDVVINEIAIVRGAPDTTEGTAQDYFGVFSPTRGTYVIQVPGGALLASPISSDPFSGVQGGTLDIVQGNPAEVRNLSVGVAQLRTIRAETATTVPRMKATLTLGEGVVSGTFENASDESLEQVAIVLGGSVAILGAVPAHTTAAVRLSLQTDAFAGGIADRVVGSIGGAATDDDIRRSIRYAMLNQLTFDPNVGFSSSLQSEKPVILAFGRRSPLDIRIGGQAARRSTNVLYYVPVDVAVRGKVSFEGDLIRETVVAGDAMQFTKVPGSIQMGLGTVTVAYRPIGFEGTLTVSELRLALNAPTGLRLGLGKPIVPLPAIPPPCTNAEGTEPTGCAPARADQLPEIEIFDRTGAGAWVRLPQIGAEAPYAMQDPARYVDPTTGQVLVRFVNDNPEIGVGFTFSVSIFGEVR